MDTVPACRSDACRQGRDRCPTPDACRLPEQPGDIQIRRRFWVAYIVTVLASLAGWVVYLSTVTSTQ
jgi:hypothetical protein